MFDIIINHFEKFLLWQSDDKNGYNNEYIKIHVKQRSNWDCGIACLMMVAKWISYCEDDLHNNIINNEISIRTTPLWTIDLYCFLRDNNIDCMMYTRTIGISSTHRDLSWYQNYLSDDSSRVDHKFKLAKDKCWIIHEKVVDLNDVANNIANGASAIILVDNFLLHNYNENEQYDYNDDLYHYNDTSNKRKHEYAGHYIFLVEFNPIKKIFSYLDPAMDASLITVSFNVLEKARSHIGTDYDIIIINRRNT
jgi:hypothetical protein